MDENADASQVIFEPPPESWRCTCGWPCTTWMKTFQGGLSFVDLDSIKPENWLTINFSGY